MKNKKIPLRLCIGCGEMRPKRELIRILKAPDDTISLDFTGKKSGRGAYLCKNTQCLALARKGHRLERSFSCRVSDEVYEEMEHALQAELMESSDHLP